MTCQRHTFPSITADEIERLLHHLPGVAAKAENEWAANFARSILRQAKRPGWQPTPKQLTCMRSLVSDLFAASGNEEGDLQVIED